MQEKWTRWEPVTGLSPKYYIQAVHDTPTSLRIMLLEEKKRHRLQLTFKTGAGSYQRTDESFCLERTAPLADKYGIEFYARWTFFIINNSDYLKFLSAQSQSISDSRDFIHFSILAIDSIMDIIAYEEPLVIIQEKKSRVLLKRDK